MIFVDKFFCLFYDIIFWRWRIEENSCRWDWGYILGKKSGGGGVFFWWWVGKCLDFDVFICCSFVNNLKYRYFYIDGCMCRVRWKWRCWEVRKKKEKEMWGREGFVFVFVFLNFFEEILVGFFLGIGGKLLFFFLFWYCECFYCLFFGECVYKFWLFGGVVGMVGVVVRSWGLSRGRVGF